MIEDLIEGISCYCDTQDQYYALDNLIRSFSRIVHIYDSHGSKYVPKTGTSFGEMRKMVIAKNNLNNQLGRDYNNIGRKHFISNPFQEQSLYDYKEEERETREAGQKFHTSIRNAGFVTDTERLIDESNKRKAQNLKEFRDGMNKFKDMVSGRDVLNHIADDKKAVTDTKAQVAQMNNDFNKTVNKPISFVKPGLIAAGGLATLGLGAYALHRYLKNKNKRKLKDKEDNYDRRFN